MHAIILSGGVGSRLWPVSRDSQPKIFIKMPCGKSLLQKAFTLCTSLSNLKSITSVTNQELLFRIKDEYQLVSQPPNIDLHYILEPFGKNTAAAVALAALSIKQYYSEDEIMLIMPSDHLISNQQAFNEAVDRAVKLAKRQKIVTFGVEATSPETGYGYIKFAGNRVIDFVEKPSAVEAKSYIKSGGFLWNTGIFCTTVKTIIKEMQEYCADIISTVNDTIKQSKLFTENHFSQLEIDHSSFASTRSESLDYAVIEKSNKIAVVKCDIGWSDIGNWHAMSSLSEADSNQNSIRGNAILHDVTNCYIESKNRVVGAVGVDNLVIIDTPDALLVASKNSSQEVKNIYNTLKDSEHKSYQAARTNYKPWGTYTVLEEGEGFKIKIIEVKPGASLSLQSHNHRSEHWVVVSGSAKIINDEHELTLRVNDSTRILAGNKHRLTNPFDSKLVMIEIQTGDYLEEDDIIRFDDIYKRANNN